MGKELAPLSSLLNDIVDPSGCALFHISHDLYSMQLGPGCKSVCARRAVRSPHSRFLCRCSAPTLQLFFTS